MSSTVESGYGTGAHGGENQLSYAQHLNGSSIVELGDVTGTHGGENQLNGAQNSNASSIPELGDVTGTNIDAQHSNVNSIVDLGLLIGENDGGNQMNQPSNVSNNLRNPTGVHASRRIVPISIVRAQLRAGDNSSYYTPHYVTIGPYHQNSQYQGQHVVEHMKRRCVEFMKGFLEEGSKGDLAHLMEHLVPDVTACYDSMPPVELSTMLLLDGCFLLVSAVDYVGGNVSNLASPASGNSATALTQTRDSVRETCSIDENMVVRDTLFLLENQIPFFVLETIHLRVTRGRDDNRTLLEDLEPYVIRLLREMLYISQRRQQTPPVPAPSHLLHLVHTHFGSPTGEQKRGRTGCWSWRAGESTAVQTPLRTGRWRRATEYCKYGNVRFKRRVFKDDEEWTVLDVRLQGGTLWVPRLRVDALTWTILRNLMALEEQESRTRRPVTEYCVFMSQLACKEEDVELLQRQGILEQFLGSDEEVAQGFANLCKGVVLDIDSDDNYLKKIWHDLHGLCNYQRNFMGSFRQKHCSDPLFLTTFVIAGFVFFFQLAQVVLALIPLLQKHKH